MVGAIQNLYGAQPKLCRRRLSLVPMLEARLGFGKLMSSLTHGRGVCKLMSGYRAGVPSSLQTNGYRYATRLTNLATEVGSCLRERSLTDTDGMILLLPARESRPVCKPNWPCDELHVAASKVCKLETREGAMFLPAE